MSDELGTIVVVGAGQAGGTAVVTLREEGFGGRVALVGREPHPPYGRPPLSKGYLTGEEGPWWVKESGWYGANGVEVVRREAVGIEAGASRLSLADGTTLEYGRLLIATGSRNRTLRIPGADLGEVYSLRTIEDADRLKEAAAPGRHAVVVGMGFMGCEVAASLRSLGCGVTAIFPEAVPLEAVLGREVGEALAKIHRERGVRLSAGDQVQAFQGEGRVEAVVSAHLGRTPCDFVVVAIGAQPEVDFARSSGIAIDNGILVDGHLRSSLPHVFAAGDVANQDHPLFGRLRVEHFNSAEKQGRCAALNMLGGDVVFDYLHTFWSDQYEHKVEYAGFAPRWDEIAVRGTLEVPSAIVFYLRQGRVAAVAGLDRGGDPEYDTDQEMAMATRLIRSGKPYASADLADERRDLASLV